MLIGTRVGFNRKGNDSGAHRKEEENQKTKQAKKTEHRQNDCSGLFFLVTYHNK